jgi:hypothetical protein
MQHGTGQAGRTFRSISTFVGCIGVFGSHQSVPPDGTGSSLGWRDLIASSVQTVKLNIVEAYRETLQVLGSRMFSVILTLMRRFSGVTL